MLTKQAQNILVDTMAAIPVIDKSAITSKNLKYIKVLNAKDFLFSSTGSLSAELNKEWDSQIGNGVK
jgi:putative spermidine/putrescine transport system substrate-binding protein